MAFRLRPRVLNAEIRSRIGSGARAPLPAAVVRGDFAVHQVLHEKLLAQPPVDVEVLGQEHRDDHPDPVVHESGRQHFADPGIHDGETGASLFPRLEIVVRLLPGKSPPIGIEFLFQHEGEMPEDRHVELPPGQFFDVNVDPCFLHRRSGRLAGLHGPTEYGARRKQAEAKVLRQSRGAGCARCVALQPVTLDLAMDRSLEPLVGRPLAGLDEIGIGLR